MMKITVTGTTKGCRFCSALLLCDSTCKRMSLCASKTILSASRLQQKEREAPS